jgi:hypothetical protein
LLKINKTFINLYRKIVLIQLFQFPMDLQKCYDFAVLKSPALNFYLACYSNCRFVWLSSILNISLVIVTDKTNNINNLNQAKQINRLENTSLFQTYQNILNFSLIVPISR